MIETLAHGYSSESTQQVLFNEYQHDRFWMSFQKSMYPCPLEESSLGIGRVNERMSTGFLVSGGGKGP